MGLGRFTIAKVNPNIMDAVNVNYDETIRKSWRWVDARLVYQVPKLNPKAQDFEGHLREIGPVGPTLREEGK